MLTPDTLRSKLDKKSKRYVFVGYDNESTNYMLYDPVSGQVKVSRHVTFNENSELKVPRQNCVLLQFERERDLHSNHSE